MELLEGLHENDLNDLVLPLVSIDEYESKIDDDAIVVGFYVQDRDPANDLNRFIQKSAISLLDTDVSPAPNEDGYYVVFVELMRDHAFPDKLMGILDTLVGLTGIPADSWEAEIHGEEGQYPVDEKTLTVMVRMDPVEDEIEALHDDEELKESLHEFFRPSILEGLSYEKGYLTFERRGAQLELKLVDFGSPEDLREHNAVMAQPMKLDEGAQSNVRRLQAFLGSHWLVEHLEGYVVLSHDGSDDVALLKL